MRASRSRRRAAALTFTAEHAGGPTGLVEVAKPQRHAEQCGCGDRGHRDRHSDSGRRLGSRRRASPRPRPPGRSAPSSSRVVEASQSAGVVVKSAGESLSVELQRPGRQPSTRQEQCRGSGSRSPGPRPRPPPTNPTQAAQIGRRSGLTAIAPTIRIGLSVITPDRGKNRRHGHQREVATEQPGVGPRLTHHLHPGEALLSADRSVAMRLRGDDLLAGEQIVGIVDLPVADQLHDPIRDRRADIGSEHDPRARRARD